MSAHSPFASLNSQARRVQAAERLSELSAITRATLPRGLVADEGG